MTGRVIPLRRPPTVSLLETPFVPSAPATQLAEVDRRWDALRGKNPAYFDGRICHVLGVHRNGCGGAALHVVDCAYRFFAVQSGRFDLGVRPLGVKGLVVHDGQVLVGRRSHEVAGYPGEWEFAPGGVVEPAHRPEETIVIELAEETGLTPSREPTAVGLIYDDTLRCWEVVYEIAPAGTVPGVVREYDELRWVTPGDLPTPLTPVATTMTRWLAGACSETPSRRYQDP